MLNLPGADHTPLRHPPLPLVVAQARFAAPITEVTLELTAQFQAALRGLGFDFDQAKAVAGGEIVISPGAAPTATSRMLGFQLSPSDGSWIVTLMPDAVSLETPSFESFDGQFGPLFEHVLRLAAELAGPVTLHRAGLRFVNVLHRPPASAGDGGVGSWARWVHPALVAPALDENLGSGLLSHSQQLAFELAQGVRSTVRTGEAIENGEEAFLLDIDTYMEPNALWSADEVRGRFEVLNEHGVALFQALVSAEMLTYLRDGVETNKEAGDL